MAAKVFTFHIVYEGLEEKIWRNIAVSSNYRLDQLVYAVLAAFDSPEPRKSTPDRVLFLMVAIDGTLPSRKMAKKGRLCLDGGGIPEYNAICDTSVAKLTERGILL